LGFKRFLAAILAAVAVAVSSSAQAQSWMPLLPDQDFYDFQLFAPPDLGDYNIYKEDRDGIYFQYDRLYWGITVPRVTQTARTQAGFSVIPTHPVSPQTIVQLNNDYLEYAQEFPIVITTIPPGTTQEIPQSAPDVTYFELGAEPTEFDLNTSWMRTKMTWGNRYEGGWSYNDRGVHLSYFQLGAQSQGFRSISEFAASSPTQTFEINFSNPGGGGGPFGGGGAAIATVTIETTSDSPPPDHLITQTLTQQNDTEIQSAGVAFTINRALGRQPGDSDMTFSLGPRFIQFAERYQMTYASYQNAFNVPAGGDAGVGPGGEVINQPFGGGAGQLGILTTDLPSTLTGAGPGSLFQVGDWETYTSNNMVGPEFGLMFEGHRGRWSWQLGGKFTAGFNWQNNLYRGSNFAEATGADYLRTNFAGGGLTTINVTQAGVGPASATVVEVPTSPLINQIFPTGQIDTTNTAEHRFVFSPIGEWRLGGRFRVSQAISLNVGYTGMWLSQIARASSNTGFITELRPVQSVARNTGTTTIYVNPAGVPQPGPAPGLTPVPPNYSYVRTRVGAFNQMTPINGGNEYVFTNGLDFGLEIKY
ncbi:MAG: hypothetical protein ACKONH_04880, partial [Planctomycetia bacterium]